ncbi:MAG: cytochrome c oxidase assembly protein [Myxococcota bacterium]
MTGWAGLAVLAAAWSPAPAALLPPFTAHMVAHMAVVALAAPLLALALPRALGARIQPIPASMLEGVAVWAWHAPALHHAARHGAGPWALEQGTFLAGGLLLWTSALGAGRARALGGVAALWLTSMHMTLLGALLALTPRLLYGAHGDAGALTALQDQHLGGAAMLLLGGAGYGAGALWRAAGALGEGGWTR